MHFVYDFASGPLVWIAFAVFIIGSFYRLISVIKLAKKDKVVIPYMNFKAGIRSIFHWVIPFASENMRKRPFFTIITFSFHFFLLVTPFFVLGHLVLFESAWGFKWWNLPEGVVNAMAILVLVFGGLLALRRITDPTVRFVSGLGDFLLMALVLSPFISGVMAYYQVGNYDVTITLHMLLGSAWLMAIPFTRVSHMLFFALTRAYMGSEFGHVRGTRDW